MNFFPKLKRALFADNLPWYVPLRDSEAKEKKIDENFWRHVRQMTQNGVKMTKKGKKKGKPSFSKYNSPLQHFFVYQFLKHEL